MDIGVFAPFVVGLAGDDAPALFTEEVRDAWREVGAMFVQVTGAASCNAP